MLKQQIENWANQIIDRVIRGQPIEDSRVELKREWPLEISKAARRIAGHANSAHGERILWLVGVDERAKSVHGAAQAEFSDWFAQIQGCFDGACPNVIDLNIGFSGQTVVALAFETDRAPYVVKNPSGGPFQRDVPWREGTRVDSAHRHQLLQMLVPQAKTPSIEPINVSATAEILGGTARVWIEQRFFLEQPPDQILTFPMHRCGLEFRFSDVSITGPSISFEFTTIKADHLRSGHDLMIFNGSGYFSTNYCNEVSCDLPQFLKWAKLPLTVEASFSYTNSERPVSVTAEAAPTERPLALGRMGRGKQSHWFFDKWQSKPASSASDFDDIG